MTAPQFRVAVRLADGKSNLYVLQTPAIQTHEQCRAYVANELKAAKVVLCSVPGGV